MQHPIRTALRALAIGTLVLAVGGTALAGAHTRTDTVASPARSAVVTRSAPKTTQPHPSLTLIHGSIARLTHRGEQLLLRLPPIRPVCPANRPCPQFIALPLPVWVNLRDAIFENAAGERTARPTLRIGMELYAAGHYGRTHAFEAAVVSVPS